MKTKLIALAMAVMAISCCKTTEVPEIEQLTLREKVGQLFNIRIEYLFDGTPATYTELTQEQIDNFSKYPCGGVTLYAKNITDPEQIKKFTKDIHSLAHYPLICIDEEGGRVARIGRNEKFGVKTYESMGAIGATGDTTLAYEAGDVIGKYLKEYGFDLDFAPVADVNSNPDNPVIGTRSFSSDPDTAAAMVVNFLRGLRNNGVEGCLKHFPGHGDTKTDTHLGYAESLKTWDEMLQCEMIPFKRGIAEGADMIMTAHICTPNVAGSIPATMSSLILQDKLRKELGYKGIIITDGMEMGAITSQYGPQEAALKVIEAGADIILGPASYFEAFDAVYNAVLSGEISEERLNESVERILALKKKINNQK